MDQSFLIQKKIFEVEAGSAQHVHELQNKISHLVNYKLMNRLEDYFDDVIPANLLLKMDQLVLDIGDVSW
ncbi:MAG TPA: contractile injection system tape measure protein, partial [Ferruginibacter sp.]|nr:contractile injection system tape measure protein [Ferruginibacter sp.]